MKKLTAILIASVVIWGCSKKMSPSAGSNSGNNGGIVMNNTPLGETKNPANTNPMPATANAPVQAGDPTGARPAAATSPAEAQLLRGQSIHNAKCGRCHGLKVTTDYTAERWISIMQVMAQKARLDETEKADVLAYVQANSKR